ncbi:hypothetical protein [Rhizobium sp. S96]|uniref:hypothetical protein n=1 Tax=Rhizobium sp. S96 TaxID=3055140 RepID=UPI0025AB4865|nr:hypothetical protein [Rhizobium sp. S96]MDM9619110.1 hypothetical protein [Rhizobium sp. S96]
MPLLQQLGEDREIFAARPWDNYTHLLITDRKHWERGPCHPSHEPFNRFGAECARGMKFLTREGRWVVVNPPHHPRKGTPMVGCTSGYYEPEWEEETAWEALDTIVRDHFTDWDKMEEDDLPFGGALSRDLSTPSLIFAAANDMIAERKVA